MLSRIAKIIAEAKDVGQKWRRILRELAPFTRRHWRMFVLGATAALAVVGIRLAIPWLFHAALNPWLSQFDQTASAAGVLSRDYMPLLLGGALWLMFFGLGFADHRERLCFARFAIGTLRDIRAAAFRAAMRAEKRPATARSGDLVSRLVGDTARMKAGLKGFLIHVATNGVLFFGGTVVLLWLHLGLGLVFATAGLAIALATTIGAAAIFRRALKYRIREGQLALAIEQSVADRAANSDFADINQGSAEVEAAVTRIRAHGL